VKIKIIPILFSLLICFNFPLIHAQKKQPESLKRNRIEKVINSGWTFSYFPSESAEKGYESPGFNDSRWSAISLPHTWNSYEMTGELRPFTRSPAETGETSWWTGWGWYRKHFTIDGNFSDHKVFLEFKGVQKYCKVWINGKYAGEHKGGYGSFDLDITGLINSGGDNLVAVAVSYLQKDEFLVHPLNEGNMNVSCGIYRDVSIVLKNKLFIPMQGSATHEGGTFITTTRGAEKDGIVNVKTWVKNDYPQPRTCILQTTIIDGSNQAIQLIKTEAVINAGEVYMFEQKSKPVKNPHLWSAEDPYIYGVNSEVIEKREVVDNYESSFGFRWLRVDARDNSLYLNDKKTELKGMNLHIEYPWLGDAVPDWLLKMDYSDITSKKDRNFLLTIDYPGNAVLFDMADKNGIISEEDFSGVISHNFSAEEQKLQIREMIRRDRNHPGIIAWCVGDEEGKIVNKAFAASEDTTRMINSLPDVAGEAVDYFIFGQKTTGSDSQGVTPGEAAKIIVSSSHGTIAADRGSIAIIRADVSDADGNHISGAKNTIRWKVTGPAKLIGPDYYVSYADSNRKTEEGWYEEMPATNIIRSNGVAGKIMVTVFSSGLASGKCEIEATEVSPDNTVINEPVLSDAGRKQAARKSLFTERLDDVPMAIAPASEDFNFNHADKQGYVKIMRDYIKKNNPSADTISIEFKTLVNLLGNQLFNNKGSVSAADYNFNIDHYNNCLLISGYISKTKLPPLFKESLKKHYSKLMISEGNEKNAGDEMNWLNWIPSGGIVVIVPDETSGTAVKGVVYTKQTALPDIIKVVYPQFAKFSPEARERALIFISKMNPSVQVIFSDITSNTPGEVGVNEVTYSAEKGQPILIPEYKFISE
jgi:hypothetical protein